jgi:hypothetical protein
MAISATLDPGQAGPDAVRKHRDEWQAKAGQPESLGAEWYLRIRDSLYAEAQK